MLFRSVSFWLGCTSSFLAMGAIFAPPAQATLTVKVVSAAGVELKNVVDNVAYYPASTTAVPYVDDPSSPPLFFRDAADVTMPAVIGVDLGIASASTDLSKLVYFSVISDKSVTPEANGYVVLFATAQGSAGGEKPIPLAFVGDASGNGALCPGVAGCLMRNTVSSSDYYFALDYKPNTTNVVGVYPADICLAYTTLYGGSATGCNLATVATNVSTASTMQLHFYVNTLKANSDGGGASTLTAMQTAPQDQSSTAVSLSFEQLTSTPAFSCTALNASTFLGDVYAPGDGEVILSTSRFAGTLSGVVAPVTQMIVLGNLGGNAAIKSAFADGSNAISKRVEIGSGQSVGGFTNTTPEVDNLYNVSFLARDAAGIVVTNQGGCALSGVRTSQIQGFLNKSSCFIATAAYRSNDAAPVMMLRRFRDLILMRSERGRGFVQWYYHWSPSAAEWLMLHPIYRYPVLVALVPVELIAWFLLNPIWAGAGMFLLVAGGLLWMMRRAPSKAGVLHET